jgi:asparagine synthase (glutamine-hydrolysing)
VTAERFRPTPLELAAGMLFGRDEHAPHLPEIPAGFTPLEALEDAVLEPLRRPPCLVSFSGGRDSSAVLAVAARVARREGLALPIPSTLRFPDAVLSDETTWQTTVVRHLDLPDWHVRELVEDEVDYVGPYSRSVLRRRGARWPANLAFHAPILEDARGGSLLTGFGGDHVLGTWTWERLGDLAAGRVRPEPQDLLRLGKAAAPRPLRRLRRRGQLPRPGWLTPPAAREVVAAWAREEAAEPMRWDRRTAWRARRRALAGSCEGLQALGTATDTLVVHPLVDPHFVAALARAGGWRGLGDRTEVMRSIFGGLLPEPEIERATKAYFDRVFWGRYSAAFAAEWDGTGVDLDLVDPDGLRAEWSKPLPTMRSAMLLQAAWLASGRDRLEETVGGHG